MPRYIDLAGQKFGKLTVLRRDETKKGGAAYWICQCECGNIKSIRGQQLRESNKEDLNCGCIKKKSKIDTTSMIGKTFGRLTVIERDLTKPIGHSHGSYWICQCECGKKTSVISSQLINGRTQSCGCLKSEILTAKNIKDITNKRFGMIVAKERTEQKNSHSCFIWRCECDCGNKEYYCSTEDLLSGKIHSCGCNKSSMGEKIIDNILTNNNIRFVREYTFNNLLSEKNRYLRFDFALLDENNKPYRLIEFDGEQHYRKNSKYYSKTIVENDKRKNEYCKNNNIPLVRIPYKELNNLSFNIIMGDKYLL